jgi:predicted transcriptional regulator
MKLTEKSNEVFEYVKANGARVSVEEICKAVDRASRSVNANVNDLAKKGLVEREKVEVEGADKPITYVVLTDEGKAFVPSEDEE